MNIQTAVVTYSRMTDGAFTPEGNPSRNPVCPAACLESRLSVQMLPSPPCRCAGVMVYFSLFVRLSRDGGIFAGERV